MGKDGMWWCSQVRGRVGIRCGWDRMGSDGV